MLCRLSFHDHLDFILSEIELFLYNLESAQTNSMLDHRIFYFYNTTFVNVRRAVTVNLVSARGTRRVEQLSEAHTHKNKQTHKQPTDRQTNKQTSQEASKQASTQGNDNEKMIQHTSEQIVSSSEPLSIGLRRKLHKLKKQDTRCPTQRVWKLSFPNHLELILIILILS